MKTAAGRQDNRRRQCHLPLGLATSPTRPMRDAGGREPSPAIGRRAAEAPPFLRSWERVFPVSFSVSALFHMSFAAADATAGRGGFGSEVGAAPATLFCHPSVKVIPRTALSPQESSRAVFSSSKERVQHAGCASTNGAGWWRLSSLERSTSTGWGGGEVR